MRTISFLFIVILSACGSETNPPVSTVGEPPSSPATATAAAVVKTGILLCAADFNPSVEVTYRAAVTAPGVISASAALTIGGLVYHASATYTGGTGSDAEAGAVWLESPLTAWNTDWLDPKSPSYDATQVDAYPFGQRDESMFVVGVNITNLTLDISGDGISTQSAAACVWQ